ncbi:MAG: metallophosphoesterase [Lachnospiraceae bacterium]|nr:metallophosphoesterase [Lachnospiraceae bacterium]
MSDFKVTRYRMRTGTETRSLEQPFSAVFLSDLHNVSYGENNSRLLQEIRNENPELVLIAGDMLTAGSEPQTDAAVALMNELTKRYQVYYANGNHERRMKENTEKYGDRYERYSNAIKSLGVHLLENGSERVEINRMAFRIWGLELDNTFFRRGKSTALLPPQMEEMIGKPDEQCYNILLAHHPAYFDTYASWGADLTLSGHLHGGMIRLPFLGGVISPQLRLFPKYDRGLYDLNGKKLVVSGGLGDHTIHLRINNPPELIVIDFV